MPRDSQPEADRLRAVAAATYVAKVKNLLLGLPATDDEVATVTADPTQLKTLVNGWMQQPRYQQKMQRFFELAFQQTQISAADYADRPTAANWNQHVHDFPVDSNTEESLLARCWH